MLEVDVDIGRLLPFARQKTGKQHVMIVRIDRSDAEHVTDSGIGRRTPPLAEDALVIGDPDDIANGQEITGIVELADELQFLLEKVYHLIGNTCRVADRSVQPSQFLKPTLRVLARRHRLFGIFVFELGERELDPAEDMLDLIERLRAVAEQPRHFARLLQVPVGIDLQEAAGRLDRPALANAGHDILQVALAGHVIEHVVDRDERNAGGRAEPGQAGEPPSIVTLPVHGRGQPDSARRRLADPVEHGGKTIERPAGHDDEQETAGIGKEIAQGEQAFALLGPEIAHSQQPAQPAPAGPVRGIGDDVGRAVGEDEAASDRKLETAGGRGGRSAGGGELFPHPVQRRIGPDDAGDGVAVGNADAGMAEREGGHDQVLRVRGAAQEGKIGGGRQFGIDRVTAHANSPCRNQRGGAPAP